MKLKLYEDMMSDILAEGEIEKDIMRYLIRYGLDGVEIPINFFAYDKEYSMIISIYETDHGRALVKNVFGRKKEIMIGIERYKGKVIFENIMKYLENLTKKDRDLIKAKNKSKDFNL